MFLHNFYFMRRIDATYSYLAISEDDIKHAIRCLTFVTCFASCSAKMFLSIIKNENVESDAGVILSALMLSFMLFIYVK